MCDVNKSLKDMTQEELEEMHFDHIMDLAYTTRDVAELQMQVLRIHEHLKEMDEELAAREAKSKLTVVQ